MFPASTLVIAPARQASIGYDSRKLWQAPISADSARAFVRYPMGREAILFCTATTPSTKHPKSTVPHQQRRICAFADGNIYNAGGGGNALHPRPQTLEALADQSQAAQSSAVLSLRRLAFSASQRIDWLRPAIWMQWGNQMLTYRARSAANTVTRRPRKLNPAKAALIRRGRFVLKKRQRELALEFDVSQSLISEVISEQVWAET